MSTYRRFRLGGFGRGAPCPSDPNRRKAGRTLRRLTLIAAAVAMLSVSGCATFNVGRPCGSCGGWLSNCRLLQKIFHRDTMVIDSCEPGFDAGMPMGAPIVAPPPGGAVIEPASPDLQLEPAPEARAPKAGSTSAARKTLYEAYKPAGGTISSRRASPPSEATSTPAGSTTGGVPPAATDPLRDLPALSVSVDHQREAASPLDVSPPAAPAVEASQDGEGEVSKDVQTAAVPIPVPTEAEPVGKPVGIASGIARFKVFIPHVAGGSVPTEAGWKFLNETGYKTVLDLRAWGEVRPEDVASAGRSGLRYVSLPIDGLNLKKSDLDRFEQEIHMDDARPLYFFDADASRAAVLWYIHLVTVENMDEKAAARDVEELGPIDPRYWLAATTYLESLKPRPATAEAPSAPDAPQVESEPATPPDSATAPKPEQVASIEVPSPPADAPAPADPTLWRAVVGLLVSSLGLPVAYYSRGVLSFRLRPRRRARASLTATARTPRGLPSASGA